MSPRLGSRTVRQEALTPEQRQRMLALMQLCYEGVDPARFAADLLTKHHVILLLDRATEELVGFSTIRLQRETNGEDAAEVLFSGDTVLHPDYWGQRALHTAFNRFLISRKLRHPLRPLRWLLLSGGYKTYLIILHYFPLTFPRRSRAPTERERAYRDAVCQRWFGAQFDAGAGILRFADHYRVRAGIAPIDRETARHPDIAFFARSNPGHVDGDELVCLAEVRLRDLVAAIGRFAWSGLKRMVASGERRRRAGRVPA